MKHPNSVSTKPEAGQFVRSELRGSGFGSMLVKKAIEKHFDAGINFVRVTAHADRTRRLLKVNGFRSAADRHSDMAKDLIYEVPRRYDLPASAHRIAVAIKFYTEEGKHKRGAVPPARVATFDAAISVDNRALFGERIAFLPGEHNKCLDAVVEIVVGGETVYFDKAKYADAEKLGVFENCEDSSYYLDFVDLSAIA